MDASTGGPAGNTADYPQINRHEHGRSTVTGNSCTPLNYRLALGRRAHPRSFLFDPMMAFAIPEIKQLHASARLHSLPGLHPCTYVPGGRSNPNHCWLPSQEQCSSHSTCHPRSPGICQGFRDPGLPRRLSHGASCLRSGYCCLHGYLGTSKLARVFAITCAYPGFDKYRPTRGELSSH